MIPSPATVRLTGEEIAEADRYCDGYRAFLDRSKTEREAVRSAVELAPGQGLPSL